MYSKSIKPSKVYKLTHKVTEQPLFFEERDRLAIADGNSLVVLKPSTLPSDKLRFNGDDINVINKAWGYQKKSPDAAPFTGMTQSEGDCLFVSGKTLFHFNAAEGVESGLRTVWSKFDLEKKGATDDLHPPVIAGKNIIVVDRAGNIFNIERTTGRLNPNWGGEKRRYDVGTVSIPPVANEMSTSIFILGSKGMASVNIATGKLEGDIVDVPTTDRSSPNVGISPNVDIYEPRTGATSSVPCSIEINFKVDSEKRMFWHDTNDGCVIIPIQVTSVPQMRVDNYDVAIKYTTPYFMIYYAKRKRFSMADSGVRTITNLWGESIGRTSDSVLIERKYADTEQRLLEENTLKNGEDITGTPVLKRVLLGEKEVERNTDEEGIFTASLDLSKMQIAPSAKGTTVDERIFISHGNNLYLYSYIRYSPYNGAYRYDKWFVTEGLTMTAPPAQGPGKIIYVPGVDKDGQSWLAEYDLTDLYQ